MVQLPIYLDNHATTRVDPRVVQAMLPFFSETFGNAGSTTHSFGWDAKTAVDSSRAMIANAIGAGEREIVFTSGATESNNLALRGLCERTRRKGNHLISVTTEHKAVLDPLRKLSRRGFEVTLLPVEQHGFPRAGWLNPRQVADAIKKETLVVSVMLANNETGVIQPLAEIAKICQERGVVLHCDATQAVGKMPVDVNQLGVDLLSFSAHKIYGPKGIGALYVRRSNQLARLEGQIDGGGQEFSLRSGTLNVPGIVGFAKAVELCLAETPAEIQRLRNLRARLWTSLQNQVNDVILVGPDFTSEDAADLRLPGNLNVSIPLVDGEALMMGMRDIAVSSGSACTSANPEPSHVLRALGLDEDQTRSSLRFGVGRFNTEAEIDYAAAAVGEVVQRLRRLSGMAK